MRWRKRMCKVGIHLCNHALIFTLAIFPGKGVNSVLGCDHCKRSRSSQPHIYGLIMTMSSALYFSQLSDAGVVESLVQLTTLPKAANGPRVRWRKLIVSEQMSYCWADQPHRSQGLHSSAHILELHIRYNLILGTQKCLTGLRREPNHSVLHVKLTTR